MNLIHWGILGTGAIARKFASDLKLIEDAELIAVGSRTKESAESFGREFSAKNLHGSYEALAQDPEVDAVYIATPHNLHYVNTILCLLHDKAVLCEKPFALHASQAAAMIELAREKEILLMEALWTKFLPHFKEMQSMIANGILGEVRSIQVNFGFKPKPTSSKRLYDPLLGGGTLMDIGIYNVFLALSILGKPDVIDASMHPAESGVDEQCAVTFTYNSGAYAQLFSTFSSNLAVEADIGGREGRLRLTSRFYEPSSTLEFYVDRIEGRHHVPVKKAEGFGYHYEARHFQECLRNGLTESPVVTFADTMLLMETLDKIRKIAGIRYPADEL
jgi:predicted dehydrogenase